MGSGLDQIIISPIGQREQRQADRQTAGPWTPGRKALLTSRLYAYMMGLAQGLHSPSSPFSLSPLALTPIHSAKPSLQRSRTMLLHEWIWASFWVRLLHSSSQLHEPQPPTSRPSSTLVAEGTANPAYLQQVPCRPPPSSAPTASVPWPGPSVLPWVTESKARQPGEEEERPQHVPVVWQHPATIA